jgi:hypothetical protein
MTASLVTQPSAGREPRLGLVRRRDYRAGLVGPKWFGPIGVDGGIMRPCYRASLRGILFAESIWARALSTGERNVQPERNWGVRVDVEWLMPVRATVVALLAAAVVACGSDKRSGSTTQRTAPATTRPPDARVLGVVLAGPTCPVATPEEPCPPRPVDAEISAQDGEGAFVASTRTDADGDYSLSLEPGDYTLVADTGGALPFCDPVTVSVPVDRSVRADISCDTGIR